MKELSQNQIKAILKKHFPKQNINDITRITQGYSHYMYDCELKDKHVILRISFNKKADLSIAKEIWVIDQYKKVGVPVPKIYAWKEQEDFDYMIMQKFEADNLEQIWNNLSENEKIQVAEEMGKLLRKMHSVPIKKFGHIGSNGVISDSFSFRKQSDDNVKKSDWVNVLFSSGLKDLSLVIAQDLITPEQSSKILKYLHSHVQMIKDCKPALVHTDFQLGHLFVKKQNNKWKIVGLIDFEFAYAYAPEFDFIKLHRAGILDDKKIKKAIMNGYGAKELHKEFDKVVLIYRLIRDIGFVGYVAKAGNLEAAKKALDFVLKTVNGA